MADRLATLVVCPGRGVPTEATRAVTSNVGMRGTFSSLLFTSLLHPNVPQTTKIIGELKNI